MLSLAPLLSDDDPQGDLAARLRDAERRLAETQELTDTGSWELDLVTGELWWSRQTRRIFEIADDGAAASYEAFLALVHPDDRELVDRAYTDSVASRQPYAVEHRLLMPDGRVKHLRETGRTFYDGGRPIRSVGSVQNVTALHLATEAMRLRDQAISTSMTPIAFTDANGRNIFANPAFVHAWGFESESQVHGLLPTDLADQEAAVEVMRQLVDHGTFRGEIVARRRDGTTFEALPSAHAVRDGNGRVANLMASFIDVSESKRLQARLTQAEKLESVGRLAGGIAHDFNNLLTVIRGFTELALSELPADDPRAEPLGHVMTASASAARLTEQLLAFSRKQVIRPEVFDLNDLIEILGPLLRRLVGEDLDVMIRRHTEPIPVRFDRGQCEQILINLVVNARDAMPDGGRLTIECGIVTLDQAYCRAHPDVTPGDYALLAVTDTGVGMDVHTKLHLFEPFYTTKGVGRGTGLGLPMVFGAVAQNGGRMEVYSEVGLGSTFKIYVPIATDALIAVTPAEVLDSAVASGGAVLLVEDHEPVRILATRALTRHGFHVVACASGEAALERLETFTGALDVLVTDVVLPGMNGRVLADRVRARRPDTRVLFTSGYTANVIVHHGVLYDGVRFLQKPYSLADLCRRVRAAIDAGPG